MIQTFSGKKAFFLGNGINCTENNGGISWGNLLHRISMNFEIPCDLENELKPFPLAFEEMMRLKNGENTSESKLRNVKTLIASTFEDPANLIVSNIHRLFMNSGVKEIITTNYDYNLEMSVDSLFLENKHRYSLNNSESRYSLYRGYTIEGVTVRHIHGELKHNRNTSRSADNYPEESIMIGFEHYSAYSVRVQNVVNGENPGGGNFEKDSVLSRIRHNMQGKNWTDLFFTHRLIMVGFSLDFSETHIWWILTKRDELRRSNQHPMVINNEIIFCIPQLPTVSSLSEDLTSEEAFLKKFRIKLNLQRNKAVGDILKSYGIIIDVIQSSSYRNFYEQVAEKYRES